MIVLCIRDHGDLGFLAKKSPKDQLPNTILMPWQYWFGITEPKSAFSTTLNASNRLLQNVKFYPMEFSTDCLPACPPASLLTCPPACLYDVFRQA